MIVGSVILAINPEKFFFTGIAFNIIGTGFFKPNISTIVGNLYREGDNRIDAGFSLFYAGVNLGGLLGGYFCITIGKGEMLSSLIPSHLAWNAAFGLSAIFMVVSLLTFMRTQKTISSIGVSPILHLEKSKQNLLSYGTFALSIICIPIVLVMVSKTKYTDVFMYIIGPCSLIYLLYEMKNFSKQENQKLIAALLFMFFSIFFWAFFEQSGGSLSLFAANNLSDSIFGIHLDPNGVNNSSNSFFVISFATVLGLLWLAMNKHNWEPNTIIKFGLGFLFLAGGFYVFYCTSFFTNDKGITSLGWFTFGWFIITFGELCLSPIGMGIMTKLSPKKLQAVIMGMWFLASAYGQYFAGLLGANIAAASEHSSNLEKLMIYTQGYKQLGIYSLVAGILIIVFSPFIKKLMHGVK
jgi:POT family proton-dependent oligopeptide transporter